MNATKNHIGNNSTTRRKKTKTTAPTVKRLHRMDESDERQLGSSERPKEISSNISATNAFLKTCFMPKLKTNETTEQQGKRRSAKTERDFYKSLSQLAEHYKVTPMTTKDFTYPYNVSLSLWDIEKQLKNKTENWDNIRLIQKGNRTFFAVTERCNTGASLFYIPVITLYQLLKNRKRRKTACLLLSVCTYLYRIADIPYYRQDSSYLSCIYEMLTDWIMDGEAEDNDTCKKELQKAEIIGDIMEKKIANNQNLIFFEQRLKCFTPKNRFDKECFQLAKSAFELYCEYPNETIYRNAYYNNTVRTQEMDEDEYYNEETAISMDKFISFFAQSNGLIYENLIDSVNNEFNEYAETQEPMIFKTFDGSDIKNKNLDFENQLFKVLDKLCELLN